MDAKMDFNDASAVLLSEYAKTATATLKVVAKNLLTPHLHTFASTSTDDYFIHFMSKL
jgi:hypothetical protein